MQKFTTLTATAAPLLRENIDTDVIIRIERLVGNAVRGTLGQWCFGSIRYLPDGSEDPAFILNRAPYRDASILIAGRNFGCGSSREGAVWSLQEQGITCVIAPSYGDIFFNNCFQNGVLPVVLDQAIVESLAAEVEASQGAGKVSVDLARQVVTAPSGKTYGFQIEPRRQSAMLEGLDEIGTTLLDAAAIRDFQKRDALRRPWIHQTGESA